MKVGICGAGIAGPTLAGFLARGGHEVTLIERAPAFRAGGYVIDFWGVGYDVAERLGVLPEVLARGYHVREVRLVRADGRRESGFSTDVFDRLTGGRFTSLARGDLAEAVFDHVKGGAGKGGIEVLFGDTVEAVEDGPEAVEVTLAKGGRRRFDLLVGADGLHSTVRRLVWGAQEGFERRLGLNVAAFRATGYAPRDEDVYLSYSEPGRSVSRFAMRGDETLFLLVFSDKALKGAGIDELPSDAAGQRRALHRIFEGCGWEVPEILARLDAAPELYVDRVSQTELPEWHRGRVALIGDAVACPSLLAGEGTGLAMTEAYVLAGELARAGGDLGAALAAYEARLKPFLAAKQKAARSMAGTFAPETAMGLWLRKWATRLMVIPPVADLLAGSTVKDDIDLPDYGI